MKCKSKNCKKILPDNYPSKYCERCQEKHAKATKIAGAATLGVLGVAATTALTVFGIKKKINK